MESVVSAERTHSYDQEEINRAVWAHLERLGFASHLKPSHQVVLKPNLLMKRKPELGTTTHPALVRGVILWLEQQGVRMITVADSPGGPYTQSALAGIYKACGMEDAVKGTCAQLNFDTNYQIVPHPEGRLCKEFSILTPLAEADIIINLPKLKTHGMMQLSAGVKNLFGAVPGLQKPELHFRFPNPIDFAQMLVDVSTLVHPTLTLVDAVVSMEGDGPSSGDLRQTGYTFAAYDVYGLDVALCAYIGMNLAHAYTVERSIAQGLAPENWSKISFLGEAPSPLTDFARPTTSPVDFMARAPKFLRRPAVFLGKRLFSPRPVVNRKKCIGCGKCAESCAPGAIQIIEKKAQIAYADCIKCYCCHEMCPVYAIRIRRGLFLSRW